MGKGSKTPAAPDYSAIAQQQAQQGQQAWQEALQAGRPNQTNQFGSLTWDQDPTTGQWTQTNQLNQPQQDIFNQQQSNQQQIANMGGGMLGGLDTSQINFSGAPQTGQVGGFNQQATDLYNQLAAPQLQRQRAAKEAQMAAMGLSLGSGQAYNTQQELLNDSENRSGMMGAQAGIQQGNTMFGQQNQLHQQGVSDILSQRQANLGQLSGLMGLGQQMQTPNFNAVNTPAPYNTANLTGAAQNQYQAQLDAANAKKASSPWGTIGGLVGGVAGSFLGPVGTAVGAKLGSSIGGAASE